jgi:hypothetical protein
MEVPSVPNTGRMVDYFLGGSHHLTLENQYLVMIVLFINEEN